MTRTIYLARVVGRSRRRLLETGTRKIPDLYDK